jgi:hypothetical protein
MIDFQVCIVILLISILKRVTFSKKRKKETAQELSAVP